MALLLLVGISPAMATAGPPAMADSTATDSVFDVERLADGVWAAVVRPSPPAQAFANSLVVAGTEAALIVDTQQSPLAARELVARVGRLTGVPVRWIVNTHRHGDHHQGNTAWTEAHPGATVVSHVATRRWIESAGEGALRTGREAVRRRVAETRTELERPGLDDETRRALRRRQRLLERYVDVLEDLELVPAGVTFRGEMEIDLGGRSVRLLDFGRAHSEGDVVVHVPDAGVVATGDLLEDGLPYLADASPMEWLRALRRLDRLDAEVWLPGHGAVQRDAALLEGHLRTFEAAARGIAAASGPTPDDDGAVEICRRTWGAGNERCRQWVGRLRARAGEAGAEASSPPRHDTDAGRNGSRPSPVEEELFEADRAFLASTREDGAEGWASFFLDEGGMMQPGYEVRGREAVLEAMRAAFSDSSYRIEWEPERARVSARGSAGFTTGRYTTRRTGPDGSSVRSEGRYVTIWERDAEGRWRVGLDIGLPDPEEE